MARAQLVAAGSDLAYLVDAGRHLLGAVSLRSLDTALARGSVSLRDAVLPDTAVASQQTGLPQLVAQVVRSPVAVAVVDDAGVYLGAVTARQLLQTLAPQEAVDA